MGNILSFKGNPEVKTTPQVIPAEVLTPPPQVLPPPPKASNPPHEASRLPVETSIIKKALTEIDLAELVLGKNNEAQGKFSEIYFSEYKTHPVAVKKLVDYIRESDKKVFTFDPIIESYFLHLAQHDYVVKFYGYVQSPQYKALVMEKCTKGNLYDFLKNSLILSTLEQRANFFYQIAQALAYIHDVCRLIHCDIKPENIILTDVDGTDVAKLCDFGFSILLKEGETEYTSTSVSGSAHYCAPERIVPAGTSAITSFASDVFAFGIIAKLLVASDLRKAVPKIDDISNVLKFNQRGGHESAFPPDPTYTTASTHTLITSMLYTNRKNRIAANQIVSAMNSGTKVFDTAKIPL